MEGTGSRGQHHHGCPDAPSMATAGRPPAPGAQPLAAQGMQGRGAGAMAGGGMGVHGGAGHTASNYPGGFASPRQAHLGDAASNMSHSASIPRAAQPTGLPRPVQAGGHTLPVAPSQQGGRRRLLDYYDFYRTPDNKKVRLGGGNYATVWKGVSRTTGEEVAFKIIVKNDVTIAEANPMHAEILKMVDHKNIIQLKDYFDEEKALCLVLELAAGGDIVERVHSAGVFTEAAAVRYSRQILCALAHCHKRGLVHCDIKCENILFASRAADSELKIADFGLAQLLPRGDKLMAGRGTPEYVAPEVIESTGYDTSADMWSVGVLIYTWMSGIFPFSVSDKDTDSQNVALGRLQVPHKSPEKGPCRQNRRRLKAKKCPCEEKSSLSDKQKSPTKCPPNTREPLLLRALRTPESPYY